MPDTTLPDDTEPSAEARIVARKAVQEFTEWVLADSGIDFWRECDAESVLENVMVAALERFRAAGVRGERPFEKIAAGLRGAMLTTKLAGEIIDLLPEGVATRDLFHQIIAILAPHISEPPHDR